LSDQSYEARLERAEYELYSRKIGRKKSHPLLFKLLRVLGFKVRPPHYAAPRFVFAFCTFYIAVLIAALLFFIQKDAETISLLSIAIKSVAVGLVFGLVMMLVNIESRKTHQLTSWEDI